MVRRLGILAVMAVVAAAALATPVVGAATPETLTAADTGLEVLVDPHPSDVVVVDSVTADCSAGETSEHEATVVSFAADPDAPSSGARLNQVVYDLGTVPAAKTFFNARRTAEQARVACGSTAKASKLKFVAGPGGVGDTRFTVTSDEKIGGGTAKVRAVVVREGGVVTQLNFIDWEPGLPSTAAVTKKAAARLG